jgi:hypothetical protein
MAGPKRDNMAKGRVYYEQSANRWVYLLTQRNQKFVFLYAPLILITKNHVCAGKKE